jgi:rhamnogalacturonyl hydrolase YesR
MPGITNGRHIYKAASVALVALTAFLFAGVCQLAYATELPDPEAIKALTGKVADWQIATFDDHGKYRALPTERYASWQNYANYHDLTWHMGALYVGMNQWRGIAENPYKYSDFLIKIGERNGWRLHKRPYHADDHTVGHFYLSLYEEKKEPAMLEPTREHFDWILANRKTGSLIWSAENSDSRDRWGWCDALFMAPPVWARLAKITGDRKYLEFMDQEYRATSELLWDTDESLFWRDSSFFEQREKNGEKVFWARGNGWVFGGLALMIPDMPVNWDGREFYIDIFKRMAVRLKEIQREDGTWSMGLLGDPADYSNKETSGTSFFTFGLAWGINVGILERTVYEPIVLRAWRALEACVTEEGMLVWVQPVGAAPGESFSDASEVYGVGAFLAAGTEVYRMLTRE